MCHSCHTASRTFSLPHEIQFASPRGRAARLDLLGAEAGALLGALGALHALAAQHPPLDPLRDRRRQVLRLGRPQLKKQKGLSAEVAEDSQRSLGTGTLTDLCESS